MTIVIGTIVVALVTGTFAVVVALITRGANKQTNAVAFAAQLGDRLEAVERKVVDLETALGKSQRALMAAIRFIDRLVEWGRSGGKQAMPKPPNTLHEYLDADSWGEEEHPNLEDPISGEK